jgi:hypothetical protein
MFRSVVTKRQLSHDTPRKPMQRGAKRLNPYTMQFEL